MDMNQKLIFCMFYEQFTFSADQMFYTYDCIKRKQIKIDTSVSWKCN